MLVLQSLFSAAEHQGALDYPTLRTPIIGSIQMFQGKKLFEIDSGSGHLLKTEARIQPPVSP